ncbi:MAG: GNAT family N-acetyltransferase [Actinomycetia bacterium]|nr:GNAT family N-acetyltransferase [Actinomycetes bacterium]MCP4224764.1 GNAT family N-acetyltransferase [Actinomycetes bacterium]MCP5032653.1 GNAT family N-acetyltransferase [Actinomycetes bacterium]
MTATTGNTADSEILDNLPWHALRGRQAPFAQGSGAALRYRRPVGVFCATENIDDGGWDALVDLVGPGRAIVLLQAEVSPIPAGVNDLGRHATLQMVAGDEPNDQEQAAAEAAAEIGLITLGADDVDEMLALTGLTEPGPFFNETHQLGTYLGVRDDGRLIAMAGERLQTENFSEISAVCTHPDVRQRGLGAALTAAMMGEIRGRGQHPLLHVAKTNTPAISVYEQLGFYHRRDVQTVVARVAAEKA